MGERRELEELGIDATCLGIFAEQMVAFELGGGEVAKLPHAVEDGHKGVLGNNLSEGIKGAENVEGSVAGGLDTADMGGQDGSSANAKLVEGVWRVVVAYGILLRASFAAAAAGGLGAGPIVTILGFVLDGVLLLDKVVELLAWMR